MPPLIRNPPRWPPTGKPTRRAGHLSRSTYIFGDEFCVSLKDAHCEMVGQGQGNPGMVVLDGLLSPVQSIP